MKCVSHCCTFIKTVVQFEQHRLRAGPVNPAGNRCDFHFDLISLRVLTVSEGGSAAAACRTLLCAAAGTASAPEIL